MPVWIVEDEGDVVFVTEGPQFLHVAVRRHDVPAVSGNRLDQYGRDPAAARVLDEVVDAVDAHQAAGFLVLPVEAAEAVRVGDLQAAWVQKRERLASESVS
jgi:hypothetical protein